MGQVERKWGSGTSVIFTGQVEQKCGSGTSDRHRPGRAEVLKLNFIFSEAMQSGSAKQNVRSSQAR